LYFMPFHPFKWLTLGAHCGFERWYELLWNAMEETARNVKPSARRWNVKTPGGHLSSIGRRLPDRVALPGELDAPVPPTVAAYLPWQSSMETSSP